MRLAQPCGFRAQRGGRARRKASLAVVRRRRRSVRHRGRQRRDGRVGVPLRLGGAGGARRGGADAPEPRGPRHGGRRHGRRGGGHLQAACCGAAIAVGVAEGAVRERARRRELRRGPWDLCRPAHTVSASVRPWGALLAPHL